MWCQSNAFIIIERRNCFVLLQEELDILRKSPGKKQNIPGEKKRKSPGTKQNSPAGYICLTICRTEKTEKPGEKNKISRGKNEKAREKNEISQEKNEKAQGKNEISQEKKRKTANSAFQYGNYYGPPRA